MPNLKCHEQCCSHNHCTHCGLSQVSVNERLRCDSFEEGDEFEDKDSYEFASDLAYSFSSDEHYINCMAKDCLNNVKGCCNLNNLRIDEKEGCPTCVNYRTR